MQSCAGWRGTRQPGRSATGLGELLRSRSSSCSNSKRREGADNPTRRAIHVVNDAVSGQAETSSYLRRYEEEELVGDSRTRASGAKRGQPRKCACRFLIRSWPRRAYGIYDRRRRGRVSVGIDRTRPPRGSDDPPMVARRRPVRYPLRAAWDRRRWRWIERPRVRWWNELQRLADDLGISSEVHHRRRGPANGQRSSTACFRS